MTNEAKLQSLDELLIKCMRCGMCLPVCPTYNLTFQEQSSPRGRIRLMRSLEAGELGITRGFVDEIYFCLDCQACQTACPAGVQYGTLVEEARETIAREHCDPFFLSMVKRFFLNGVLASSSRTKLAASMMRLYQRSGLREAVERSNILSLFSESLNAKHRLLPTASPQWFDESVEEVVRPEGEPRGRVAFLSGCIMNVAMADIHHDAVEVLVRNGFEVVIPRRQECCGSLHAHHGDFGTAKVLAKKNIDLFDGFTFDALVIDSAGCGAFMKEYGKVFADDPAYAAKAKRLSEKAKDISEFLVESGFKIPEKPYRKKVTYHEACHLVHTQKISQQPRELLQSIPGIEFIELPEATWCCGSAGIYNVVRYDDSMKMLQRKSENLRSTGAEIVVTANPGCHLQIQYGIQKFGLQECEVVHPVTLLNRAYKNGVT
jgi:glycolate oxidase iron-sulfur subunit